MNTPNHSGRDLRVPIAGGAGRTAHLRDRVRDHAPEPLSRFEDAFADVQADDRLKWDASASRTDLLMKDGALVVPSASGDVEEARLRPTRWALGQMCARLGIPGAYFAACPSVLQDVQANYFLKGGPSPVVRRADRSANHHDPDEERWLLRASGDRLRAVLSSTYSPLDNKLLMETLAPMIDSRLRVDWFALTDESLHLRLVDPAKTRDVLPGDGLSVGVHISNSEVGARALCVDALIYRLICSNGLIALVKGQSLLKRRHVHMAPLRFKAALEEAVESAFATAEEFLEQLGSATRQAVPDPESAIEKLGEKWGLSEPVREAAKVALWREETVVRHSAYGLVNAFTGVAQLLIDDRRYDLEVLAGQLAQGGVPAFALAPREKQIPVTRGLAPAGDVTAHVQQTFGARIVGRRPLVAAGSREEA